MQAVLEQPRSAAPAVSHRETDDTYHSVIVRHGPYRVIICRDDHQWIFQKRRKRFKPGGTGWNYLAYVASKTSLIRIALEYSGHAWPELEALPPNFRKGGLS
ncbi:hypothetical protein ACJ5NV_13975 [Loktanella agnita]|uniref:hypothetical protein n=1 Tax=Loktanella agnita TaxID=287097 RepID=UPI0039859DCA